MINQNEKISLTQKDYIISLFRKDLNISKHWDVEDMYEKLESISSKQYTYLLALFFNHKYVMVNKMLNQFNVERI